MQPNTVPPAAPPAAPTAPPPPASPAINYQAFQQHLPASQKLLWSCLTAIFGLLLGCLGVSVHEPAVRAVAILLIVLSIVGGVPAVCIFVARLLKQERAQLNQFLQDNNWSVTAATPETDVATSLLGVGYAPTIRQAFGGIYRGRPFTAVVYEFTTGNGKSQQVHRFVNLHFTLANEFPLIVLDDKHNDSFFNGSLPERIRGGTKLELEGDFNDRFKVTVIPGSEQTVLQLLTPDFMQDLLSDPVAADIELEANQLFIIKKAPAFKMEALQNLFGAADVMLKNINEVSDTWQASSSAQTITQMVDQAIAPREKQLLHPRHVTIGSIIALVVYAAFQIVQALLTHHH